METLDTNIEPCSPYRRPDHGSVQSEIARCADELGVSIHTVRLVWLKGEPCINKPRKRVKAWLQENGYAKGPGRPADFSRPLLDVLEGIAATLGGE